MAAYAPRPAITVLPGSPRRLSVDTGSVLAAFHAEEAAAAPPPPSPAIHVVVPPPVSGDESSQFGGSDSDSASDGNNSSGGFAHTELLPTPVHRRPASARQHRSPSHAVTTPQQQTAGSSPKPMTPSELEAAHIESRSHIGDTSTVPLSEYDLHAQ